jgi:hypothetical protein
MVCHQCGKPAVGTCCRCSRCVCNDHVFDYGSFGVECKSCGEPRAFREATEERERDEAIRRKMSDHLHPCAFCGTTTLEHFYYDDKIASFQRNYRRGVMCGSCRRYFCPNHGYEKSLRDGRRIHTWRRCQECPIKKSAWRIVTAILVIGESASDYERADSVQEEDY